MIYVYNIGNDCIFFVLSIKLFDFYRTFQQEMFYHCYNKVKILEIG